MHGVHVGTFVSTAAGCRVPRGNVVERYSIGDAQRTVHHTHGRLGFDSGLYVFDRRLHVFQGRFSGASGRRGRTGFWSVTFDVYTFSFTI